MLKITRTTARFSKVNPRVEMHGDDKVQASDISVSIPLPAEPIVSDLTQNKRLSDFLHTADGRVNVPAISPIVVHRTLDGMKVTIWDNPEKPLKLSDVTLKDPTLELLPNKSVELKVKLQTKYGPGQLERLADLMQNSADIEIEATQTEIAFEDDKEKQDKGSRGKKKTGSKKTSKKASASKK